MLLFIILFIVASIYFMYRNKIEHSPEYKTKELLKKYIGFAERTANLYHCTEKYYQRKTDIENKLFAFINSKGLANNYVKVDICVSYPIENRVCSIVFYFLGRFEELKKTGLSEDDIIHMLDRLELYECMWSIDGAYEKVKAMIEKAPG